MEDHEKCKIPFPEEAQLNDSLKLDLHTRDGYPIVRHTDGRSNHLPGRPSILFAPEAFDEFENHIFDELVTPDLDKLAPYLWLVAIPESTHISALHQQIAKGRKITIAEKADLHCTWIYDQVFLKPIPPFLLSWAFWQVYLISPNSPLHETKRSAIRRAAIGYLRSYALLIKYPSDFRIAVQHHLIPDSITYEESCGFFAHFSNIVDSEVPPRYHYGELRLGRLNLWAKVFLRRFTFQKVQTHYDYGFYFARFYGPILFLFGGFSVILSAMQVGLAVDQSIGRKGWITFEEASRGFSVFSIICVVAFLASLAMILLLLVGRETVFALEKVFAKRWSRKPR